MKKIFYLVMSSMIMTNISYGQAHSRAGGAYFNLEKYWFYRYRLVNDFMKIGPNCGESIPVAARHEDKASGLEHRQVYFLQYLRNS